MDTLHIFSRLAESEHQRLLNEEEKAERERKLREEIQESKVCENTPKYSSLNRFF